MMEGLFVWEEFQNLEQTRDKKLAAKVCKDFFDNFGERHPAKILWLMLSVVMKNDDEELTGAERGNFIHFYEQALIFFKAAAILTAPHPKSKN